MPSMLVRLRDGFSFKTSAGDAPLSCVRAVGHTPPVPPPRAQHGRDLPHAELDALRIAPPCPHDDGAVEHEVTIHRESDEEAAHGPARVRRGSGHPTPTRPLRRVESAARVTSPDADHEHAAGTSRRGLDRATRATCSRAPAHEATGRRYKRLFSFAYMALKNSTIAVTSSTTAVIRSIPTTAAPPTIAKIPHQTRNFCM